MRNGRGYRERGVALVALLAVIMMGGIFMFLTRLNADANTLTVTNKNRNAEVLNRAKQALIGYIAAQAAKDGEDRPGAFPCPEAAGYFDDPTNDGQVASSCTLPKVGRFPWRTLGTDKLVDAAGEPLWYAVASGWASTGTVINSNCASTTAITGMACTGPAGRLTIDGATSDVVAIIIAPGPAISVSTSTNCTAWSQVRATTGTPDWRNYLECENATNPANSTFATTGPSGSFNDQLVTITTSEILPAIEAAIAHRFEREIAADLKTNYSGWLPFAAAFANPTASSLQGTAGLLQGLLPLAYTETAPESRVRCTPGGSPNRCFPSVGNLSGPSISGGATTLYSTSCAAGNDASATTAQINCTLNARCLLGLCGNPSVNFTITATAADLARSIRKLNPSWGTVTGVSGTPTAALSSLNADGSGTVTISGTTTAGSASVVGNAVCSIAGFLGFIFGCQQNTVSIQVSLFTDHGVVDSTDSTYGWFMNNRWHEVTYYAVASGYAGGGAKSCTTGTTCLTVNGHRNNSGVSDAGAQRAVLLFSGRSLTGATRPNATLADWFEGANADGASPFEVRAIANASLITNRTFNDRVAVLDSN